MIVASGRGLPPTTHRPSQRGSVRWAALAALLTAPAVTLGQAPATPARGPLAKVTCPAASFLTRQAGGREFRTVAANADVYPGDLLIGLPGATLETKTGVALTTVGDLDAKAPVPILDTAVMLHPTADADAEFTLDRGRVDVTNKKPTGPATVRVRYWDQQWLVVLHDPGDRVALAVSARWPAGTRFRPVAATDVSPPRPHAALIAVVLKGRAEVKIDGVTFGMKAAPGFAMIEWDSASAGKPLPQRLEQSPAWVAAEPQTDDGKKAAAACDKYRTARAGDLAAALTSFLGSSDPVERRLALATLGATDDVEKLGRVLNGAKTLDEWDFGIVVARHWMGRAPGQDQAMYGALQAIGGLTAGQARIVVQLLLGFTADDLKRPETYEVLIEYLLSERPAVRNLAAWHLVRLVPQGKAIKYNPSGSAADAQVVFKEWKKLIPDGQLPPAAKP